MSLRHPHPLLRRLKPNVTRPTRPSNVARGTAYELAVQSYLLSAPYNCTSLVRIGGAGDAGVDLRGKWGGQPVLPPPLEQPEAEEVETDESVAGLARPARRWAVVVQCKAYSKPVGPAVVRELEGVLSAEEAALISTLRRHAPFPSPPSSPSYISSPPYPSSSDTPLRLPPPTIGFLFSLSGFSPAASTRGLTSKLPLSLCHLRPKRSEALDEAARRGIVRGVLKPEEVEVVSMTFNRALERVLKGG
ncbi:hypothetical protein JCM11251_007865 [Rhodosporidiobolus azoricus]